MPVQDMNRADRELGKDLLRVARTLAAGGATGDTVLSAPEARRLPQSLTAGLDELVRPPDPHIGHRVVKGLLDCGDPGPTPLHWRASDPRRSADLDIALALVASRLGRVFGWRNQQDGRIVHNILPSPGQERLQVGAGSVVPLAWHTEDAFHPYRADILLLACVRNPDDVGSRLSSATSASLTAADVAQLQRPLTVVLPDDSYADREAELRRQIGIATLWHREYGALGIRYDPSYMHRLTDDPDFIAAFDRLGHALEANGHVVPLEPGDLLIIDNDAVVHGRLAFTPRYDGTDRWLKRVLVRSPRPRPARERQEHGYDQEQVDAHAG
ncbi:MULTISPECIES: TauD/TfdA family dioxygenase [unclassified Streptomyces]|uniref:TauD/TfdA family dioxygenase n=1 Tax=unclassified Streptomyces TaxID=2593676 RepID=UPI002251086B|nr:MULTISPECIES: TauD/TfdA family dioxygenase [unclassified Streptomyces]MCX4461333.1 TauD/TfdA family dioxygenase [Streptomyces sp. NBC_01719]MCX4490241.1 TauD/TfdA family dioxygenase [Streptomyces sp. NBC_01728]